MNRYRLFLVTITVLLLTGCERTNWISSVPTAPIHLEINTHVGMYVNFVPENVMTYLIADEAGIHFNGHTQPLLVTEACGYGGTVVYIDGFHPYGAYDLCCPHCFNEKNNCYRCTIDGMFAVCPECGEEYDIYSGNGVPTRGISKETLKQYRTTYNAGSGMLLVTQR